MTDDVDRASEREELHRNDALTFRFPELKPLGYCYWCSSGVGGSMVFCSRECVQDYQKVQDAKKRNGK